MAPRLRILVAASEAAPLAKTGGLGDVMGALPRALRGLGHDVRIFMPRHRGVEAHASEIRTIVPRLAVPLGDRMVEGALQEAETPAGVPVYFLAQDQYFDRDGLYGTADGDYWDNCERFVFFCRGALESLIELADGWRPQVIHCNDWQTGLIPVYLKTLYRDHPVLGTLASVLTIHNLAYQGVFWHYDMAMTGLGWDLFTPAGLEFYGKINLLKGGLVFSDLLTTVSRTYAEEIRTPELGNGLDGVLEERAADLHGVVNGIDYELWNPAKDPALPRPYSADEPEGKAACRETLRRELGLEDAPGPIVAMVARLVEQKGLDLVLAGLSSMLDAGCQVVLLGSGEPHLEEAWAHAAERHPGRVAVRLGYDTALASRIYGGADCFLMPSRYEPCGLGQLIALRYGAVPIVRRTGGLADTVKEFDATRRSGTGFLWDAFEADAMVDAVRRAAGAHRRPELWSALVRNGMTEDFSWDASAREYALLYKKVLRPAGPRPSRRSR
ncbi:MAG TPA: glycogen synthase GlgA [Candidatus Bathyarchaeia archaeon]|nr:glycogen synthase GlgA [Candidatus Bathyarchaeia archaeon]